MTEWVKVEDPYDIPLGEYVVVMEDGGKGYCEVHKSMSGKIIVVNHHFHFDYPPIVAYIPLPKYEGD